jgi:predicted aspartyl protease
MGSGGWSVLLVGLLITTPALACQVQRVAQVPIILAQGFPLVPVQAAGRSWNFLLDTGAEDHLLTPWAATALGLSATGRVQVLGTVSTATAPTVALDGLSLGGLPIPGRNVPAASLPGLDTLDPAPAGIIGLPFLGRFDLLIDGPGRQLTLFAVQDCQTVPVPFLPAANIPLHVGAGGQPLVTMQIHGRPVEAIVDTGARGTVMTGAAAARTGLGPLRVGTDDTGPRPTITPLALGDGEALLGWDYLGARRTWVSFATAKLIVSLPVR